MYLIKNVYFDHRTNDVKVEDGIQIGILGNSKTIARDDFWGKTEVHFGNYADFTKIPTISGLYNLLSYVSEYEVENTGDGFKKFSFYVSTYQPEKKEGYIIFIKQSLKEIKTNGQKIFGRYPTEIVAVLKDGNYLEFDGRRIEVIGVQLTLLL